MRKGRWFYSCDVSVTWRSQTNTNFKVLLSLAQYIKYGMEFYVIFNAKHVNLGEKATGEMINNFRNFSGMISSKGGGEENSSIKQLVRCATSVPGFFYSGCFQVSTMVLNLNDMAVVHDIVESQIRFTCKFEERNCNGLSKTKRAGTKETIRLPPLYPFYNNTCTLERP